MKSMSAIVLFLCAPLGLALGRFAVLLVIPVDEARADDGHLGDYPLHCAAGVDGDLAAVVHLLEVHGIDVNARFLDESPLRQAVKYGRATIVATLIAAGANVNVKNNGHTPLRTTWDTSSGKFRSGGAAVASVLIAAGGHWGEPCAGAGVVNPAGPTTPCICESPNDNDGETPLVGTNLGVCEVVAVCDSPAVLDMVANRCDCPAPNLGTSGAVAPGNCQAPSAESCGSLNPPQLYDSDAGRCGARFYPCHDSAIRKADNSGCECPEGDYAHGDPSGGEWNNCERYGYRGRCIRRGEWRVAIPSLAICHADHAPLAHDLNGWYSAVQANNPTLVAHFIADHGQDPDAGYALHLAVRHGRGVMITLLIWRGADVNLANDRGDTPLHEAVLLSDEPENVALVSLLLDKGADPNIRNHDRWRPLDLAYNGGVQARRKIMAALIAWGANWSDECTGGAIPNEYYRPEFGNPETARCVCPPHISKLDPQRGKCECPAHSHAQVNGRCLAKDSAQVELEIAKMRLELERLRLELAELNVRLSLAADGPPETLEEVAKQAEVAARGIARRRDNFLALARAGLAEADDAGPAPALALSDTEATCRMLEGEVQTHSRSGAKICSGIDHNDTFCIVGSASAFPCVGFFRHVRRCNDDHNRPALDPWHCAAPCPSGLRARGAKCEPES